jgi:hypothetical protein
MMGETVRKVEITADPYAQRCWIAVDTKSGGPMLRLHDRDLLERIYRSLEWKIAHDVWRAGEAAEDNE